MSARDSLRRKALDAPLTLAYCAPEGKAAGVGEPFHRGYMYSAAGQAERSIVQFREAIRADPDDVEAYFNLGLELCKTKRLAESIVAFREVIKRRPDFAEAYYCLGLVLNEAGHQVEAISAYRAAIRHKPNYVEAYNNLGTIFARQEQFPKAIAAYRRAVKISDYVVARNNLALAKERFGETKKSRYTGEPPSSEAAVKPPLRMGDDLNTKVKKAKAENLARGKARPSTHQLATYRALLQHVDLLNPELAEDEQLRRARRLVHAYERLRERRPKFHDHNNKQLLAAFSIINKVKYRRATATKTAQKAALAM